MKKTFFLFYFLPVFAGLWIAGFFMLASAEARAAFSVVLLAAFAFLAYQIRRSLGQPLEGLEEGMDKITAGHLNWRMPGGYTQDEAALLRARFNRMAEGIQERMENLSRSLAESEAILSGMEEGVLILDLKGRVQKMNASMGLIVPQLSPRDVGKHFLEVFRDPELNELFQETLARRAGQSRSLSLLSQPGKFFHVQSSLIHDSSAGAGGVVVVFHDMTDVKRLERVRQDFVANVSHELRTPLTAVKGYVEALLDGGLVNGAQAGEFLKVIDRHVARMDKIVSDLLLLSEVESTNRGLRIESLSIAELIASASEAVAPEAESKGQTLEVKVPPDLPRMEGDAQKLYQAVVNLMVNAVRYTPERGFITVSAHSVEKGLEVTVADNGIGIPAADLPRIFERFYRVDKGRSRELGGTGLGLSIVKHIAEAHGGRVLVESKPGQGSRFTLFLPHRVA